MNTHIITSSGLYGSNHTLPFMDRTNSGSSLLHKPLIAEIGSYSYNVSHITKSRLLLSGDTESNPGPSASAEGTIKYECNICKRDIKGTALAAAHETADEDCSANIYAKCDDLGSQSYVYRKNQARYKMEYFCTNHGSGMVTVTNIVPEPSPSH